MRVRFLGTSPCVIIEGENKFTAIPNRKYELKNPARFKSLKGHPLFELPDERDRRLKELESKIEKIEKRMEKT